MAMLKKALIAATVSMSLSTAATAQALLPFVDVMDRAASSYPFSRCAALFASVA